MRYTDRIVSDFLKFGDILIHMMELSMKAKKTFLVVILCVVGFSSFAGEVFGSLFMMGRINNNQIQSFPLDVQTGLSLTRNNKADFVLPAGASSVFGVGYSVGVVVGNNVQFFTFDGSSYTRNNKADFVLP